MYRVLVITDGHLLSVVTRSGYGWVADPTFRHNLPKKESMSDVQCSLASTIRAPPIREFGTRMALVSPYRKLPVSQTYDHWDSYISSLDAAWFFNWARLATLPSKLKIGAELPLLPGKCMYS